MILTEGFRLVLRGIVIGFVAAFALTKLISTQLYGVSARDPLSLILVTALLAIISLLACWMAGTDFQSAARFHGEVVRSMINSGTRPPILHPASRIPHVVSRIPRRALQLGITNDVCEQDMRDLHWRKRFRLRSNVSPASLSGKQKLKN